jgi:hypothetical protein
MPRVPRATADHPTLDRFQPSDPPPPPRGVGRLLRLFARLVLWSLIALGALRGFGPLPDRPADDGTPTTTAPDRADSPGVGSAVWGLAAGEAAMATASAFLRDYLTIDGDQRAWAQRLERYLAKGLDVGKSVSVPAGTSQYVDYVQPVATRSTGGGAEVTALAHLLESRSGTYRDGGMLAFVVPLARGRRGLAVSALPRPASLPMAGGMTVRQAVLSPETARDVTALARHAVAALLNEDRAGLAALGGDTPPQARSLPDGWRAVGITTIQAAGPPEEPTAQVLVRARPPTGGAEYVIAVLVSLRLGPDGLLVRRVDAGGMP